MVDVKLFSFYLYYAPDAVPIIYNIRIIVILRDCNDKVADQSNGASYQFRTRFLVIVDCDERTILIATHNDEQAISEDAEGRATPNRSWLMSRDRNFGDVAQI